VRLSDLARTGGQRPAAAPPAPNGRAATAAREAAAQRAPTSERPGGASDLAAYR
jgi:hypothetical protein